MTKAYDNELRGVLFKNDDKETDSHPDYKGNATVNGVDYFMDAWINTADSGRKYMSVKFKAKDKQAGRPATPAAKKTARAPAADYDDRDGPPF